MVRQVMKHYGRIDILINNAGITIPEPFLKLTTQKVGPRDRGQFKRYLSLQPGCIAPYGGTKERPYYQSVIGFGKDR